MDLAARADAQHGDEHRQEGEGVAQQGPGDAAGGEHGGRERRADDASQVVLRRVETDGAVQVPGGDDLGDEGGEGGAGEGGDAAVEQGDDGDGGHGEVAGEGEHREDAGEHQLRQGAQGEPDAAVEAVRESPAHGREHDGGQEGEGGDATGCLGAARHGGDEHTHGDRLHPGADVGDERAGPDVNEIPIPESTERGKARQMEGSHGDSLVTQSADRRAVGTCAHEINERLSTGEAGIRTRLQ